MNHGCLPTCHPPKNINLISPSELPRAGGIPFGRSQALVTGILAVETGMGTGLCKKADSFKKNGFPLFLQCFDLVAFLNPSLPSARVPMSISQSYFS